MDEFFFYVIDAMFDDEIDKDPEAWPVPDDDEQGDDDGDSSKKAA